ncbi:MAG TPA: twin-arginine translocase TatA/TatE family subunit [Dehalococcoidia bacterium]|nr:twin-arginine translocase TatA/TatE family subunit [Dehalococcoidia bacterium]
MPTIHGWEALVILAVVLIVFGVGKLPQVGGALGRGLREFRRGKSGLIEDVLEEDEDEVEEKPKRKKPAAKKKTATKKTTKKLAEGKTKKK